MDRKIPITITGYNKMQEELRELKEIERPAVVDAIAAARALGDLSENAEYHAAKDKQGMIEARISILENKLTVAEVIDPKRINSDTIRFSATVTLMDEDSQKQQVIQIVGSDESDVQHGLIPITSPVATALIGKKQDDYVEVQTPRGTSCYTILKVEYK